MPTDPKGDALQTSIPDATAIEDADQRLHELATRRFQEEQLLMQAIEMLNTIEETVSQAKEAVAVDRSSLGRQGRRRRAPAESADARRSP